MPLFLDVHSLDDPVTLNDVTQAHDADLRTQPGSGAGAQGAGLVTQAHDADLRTQGRVASTICATGWTRRAGKIFCLVDAPSGDVAADMHREAHGLVAQEIYQVTEGGH
jgi:hypothetical protein